MAGLDIAILMQYLYVKVPNIKVDTEVQHPGCFMLKEVVRFNERV